MGSIKLSYIVLGLNLVNQAFATCYSGGESNVDKDFAAEKVKDICKKYLIG